MPFVLLIMLMSVTGQCEYSQQILLGQQYQVYNNEYPSNYKKGTNCRWSAVSEPGTLIMLSCEEIDIPESKQCQYDKLTVSLSGNSNFTDANIYCGKIRLNLLSKANAMVIGLSSSDSSPFTETGKFKCSITSIQGNAPSINSKRTETCDCGWKQGMRIVGGTETGVNEYPFMCALVDIELKSLFCGASIISERYAVTAAHCFASKMVNNVVLLVGDHNISTGADTPYSKLYLLQEYIIHPEYDNITTNNDIALVKTKYSIEFSLYVGPICLPFRYTTENLEGLSVTALGWGSIDFWGPKSDVLQEITFEVISNELCRRIWQTTITDRNVCTYGLNKDTCRSDSGGPIVWMVSTIRRLQLIGVVSYGLRCNEETPSVNTRVTSFLPWIVSKTAGEIKLRNLVQALWTGAFALLFKF